MGRGVSTGDIGIAGGSNRKQHTSDQGVTKGGAKGSPVSPAATKQGAHMDTTAFVDSRCIRQKQGHDS